MILYIKNMTTVPSKILVEQEMQNLRISYLNIGKGMVENMGEPTKEQKEELGQKLLKLDLELLEDNKSILTEKVKSAIHEMISFSDELPKMNYSDHLSEKLGYDYTYMANVFIAI